MSHFYTLVLVEGDKAQTRDQVEERVESLLEPYSENKEFPPHMVRCFCIGNVAHQHAVELAEKKAGSIESFRNRYWAMKPKVRPEWEDFIKPYTDIKNLVMSSHSMRLKPDPSCESCKGTGQYETTCNDRGYWDWYAIGGRWTGWLSGYDPQKDPRNLETCFLCHGSGVRRDKLGIEAGQTKKKITAKGHPRFGQIGWCNGCEGVGKSVRFHFLPHEGDIMPAARLLDMASEKWVPRAIVTPEGEWIQKGIMGWWGMSREDMKDEDWNAVAKDALETVLKKNPGCVAVVVDCHI